jgi:hypothetical protein
MVKQWVGAQVDGSVAAEVERVAKSRGISRSDFIREALQRRLREALEEDEERLTRQESNHRQVMRRFDYLVGMIREQERLLGLPAVDPANGSGDQAHRPELESDEVFEEERADESSDGGSKESPLAEARKRARRRVE